MCGKKNNNVGLQMEGNTWERMQVASKNRKLPQVDSQQGREASKLQLQ